jgi:hypothetical protein
VVLAGVGPFVQEGTNIAAVEVNADGARAGSENAQEQRRKCLPIHADFSELADMKTMVNRT